MNFFKRLLAMFRKQKTETPAPVAPVAPPVVAPVAPPVMAPPVGSPVVPPTPTPTPTPPPIAGPVGTPSTWPRILVRNGVNVMAAEWISDLWLPSMEAWVFGHQPGTSVGEPSNAPAGLPRRSAAGYPLIYAIGGDGQAVGAPRVSFNGVTHDNDAAILTYVEAMKTRDTNLAEWQRLHSSVYYLGRGLKATDMSVQDRVYLYAMSQRYFGRVAAVNASTGSKYVGDLHRVILEGRNFEIAQCINDGAYNGGDSFDPAQYNGPCRAVVEAAFAALDAGTPWESMYEMR